MKTVELYARVRHAVLIEGISERAPRPPHASRPCPRDERRQLQARSLQAPVTPSPIRAAVGRCPSGMKRDKQEGPDIGAFLLASVLHFYSGRPLQNLSGVDTNRLSLLGN